MRLLIWVLACSTSALDNLPKNAPECPGSFTADGGCDSTANCRYPQGVCQCIRCKSGASQWACRRWDDVNAGCPVPPPSEGSSCDSSGLYCNYDGCCRVSLGPLLECVDGVWQAKVDTACSCIPAC